MVGSAGGNSAKWTIRDSYHYPRKGFITKKQFVPFEVSVMAVPQVKNKKGEWEREGDRYMQVKRNLTISFNFK